MQLAVATALYDRLHVIPQNTGEAESKADIMDGDMYRCIRREISEHDFTLTLNADGALTFKSNYIMWPAQVIVNFLDTYGKTMCLSQCCGMDSHVPIWPYSWEVL